MSLISRGIAFRIAFRQLCILVEYLNSFAPYMETESDVVIPGHDLTSGGEQSSGPAPQARQREEELTCKIGVLAQKCIRIPVSTNIERSGLGLW